MFKNIYRRLPFLILSPMFCWCPADVLPFLPMWYRCAAVLVGLPIPENRQICAPVLLRRAKSVRCDSALKYDLFRGLWNSWSSKLKNKMWDDQNILSLFYLSWDCIKPGCEFLNHRMATEDWWINLSKRLVYRTAINLWLYSDGIKCYVHDVYIYFKEK